MKTYEQHRREILNKFDDGLLQGPVTFGKIEEIAAKEYAKQWVAQVVNEISDSPHGNDNMITYYHLAIDAQ